METDNVLEGGGGGKSEKGLPPEKQVLGVLPSFRRFRFSIRCKTDVVVYLFNVVLKVLFGAKNSQCF